ncbi:MAG: glycosyltransferase [Victivallaceae bacterium]|nr:glycosyltransferase [Victivallaceae bacterium]MDD3117261.1 glycosyltransferase [Victivallaceae bacterium]MDD3703161.1 glycosyltransferase [Victivallaceae bacterium]MDD4317211.1 glycosyltransferase [Victivallaceae bacterium]
MFEKDYSVKKLSVVVPVYNEEGCLQELIDRCLKSLDKTGKDYELILVDDGSVDRSIPIMIEAAEKNDGKVVAVILNRNYGQHSAIMAGFAEARGDLVITIDADLQNPPEEFPRMVEKAEEGFDVVGTVRANRKDSVFRKLPSWIVNRIVQKVTGVKMRDYGCMLRAYRGPIVKAMLACNERSTFIPVLGNSFARTSCEIDVGHSERTVGTSKYSFIKLINLQFNLLTCMTTAPLRLMSYVGGLVSLFGIVFGITVLFLRFYYDAKWAADGVFTLMAFVFIIAGVEMIALGLIGEYLGRMYYDVRARPRYFVETVFGRKENN